MNLRKIAVLAAVLFVAQALLGFVEGSLQPANSGISWFIAGHAASFFLCSAIFALFAARYPVKPFIHAWVGLLLQVLIALGLSALLPASLGSNQWASVTLEWAVLVVALIVGTSVGMSFRSGSSKTADA